MAYARELSVEYGSLKIGGNSDRYLLTDIHIVRTGFITSTVEFEFVTVGQTDSSFASAVQDAETKLRTPDQDLVIQQGGSKLVTLKQSDNTGFDAMPEILKRGDPTDTARTRTYRVRVEIGMPGQRAGVDGLRQSTVSVSYEPSRKRRVTIAGEFTAWRTTAARAQYEAKIDALCSAALTALTGTFELAEEVALHTTNDKTASFQRVYDEVIYTQGGEGVDSASIVRQRFSVTKQTQRSTPQSGDAKPWLISNVSYECWVDKDVTQDLQAKWESIRGWVISTAAGKLGGTAIVLSEEPRFHFDDNRITAELQIAAQDGELIRYTLTYQDEYDAGKVRVPVWIKDRPLSRYVYQGPATYVRTVTESAFIAVKLDIPGAGTRHDTSVSDARGVSTLTSAKFASSGDWLLVSQRVTATPRIIGIADYPQECTEYAATTVLERVEEVAAVTPGQTSASSGATTPGGGK